MRVWGAKNYGGGQLLSACEKELGFTPVSRARVRRAGEDEPDEGGDFADF